MMFRTYSLLLLAFMAAAATSNASAVKQTYIIHMDKTRMTYLDDILGGSRKWYEEVIDSINELSIQEEETSPPQLLYAYETAMTGFSAKLSIKQLEGLKKIEGFLSAVPDDLLTLHTTRSPHFLGLHSGRGLWNSHNQGTDVIIGLVDTGIWPEHVSFHDGGMSPVPSKWKGTCEEGTMFTTSNCNRKIIGARAFFKGYEAAVGRINETMEFRSARDSLGHGTHTASTAAGAVIPGASLFGMGKGFARGMMYTSRIAVYKACFLAGCANSDILAAVDQAVADGVDVLSLSAGTVSRPYYHDTIAIASFGAVQNGVFVSCSAGNSGPLHSTVGNSAPWIMTVAASSLDRSFPTVVKLGNGKILHGASLYSGQETEQLPLAYGENAGTIGADYCFGGSLFPNIVKGKIVVCKRGMNSRPRKGEVVKMAGGAGLIVLNTETEGEDLFAEAHVLPAASLGASAAKSLMNYINSGNSTASIVFQRTGYGNPAPVMAAFSSRGPALAGPYVIKPDVTAPGQNILAAWPPTVSPSRLKSDNRSVLFNILSGTSMSCPHVSGLAALLKSVHKDWSPAAIKSALMTTANTHDNRGTSISDSGSGGSSATPFAYGSGHVDPERASNPGLIYDITADDYLNYLCSLNYTSSQMSVISRGMSFTCPTDSFRLQPGDLNYPSFAVHFNGNCHNVTYRRTVTNVGSPNSIYVVQVQEPEGVSVMVRPHVLRFRELNQKLSYEVTFTASPETWNSSDWSFGSLVWGSGICTVRSPIAVTWQQLEE